MTVSKNAAPITFADPEIHQNPAPIYERLRHESPVYLDPVIGLYIVSTDALLREVLSNHDDYSSVPDPRIMAIYADDPEVTQLYLEAGAQPPMSTLVTTDPPQHRRYRSLVERAIGATSVKRMREAVVQIADELIDGFIAHGKVELVEAFSLKLPVYVVSDLLGIPREHADVLQSMGEATTRLADGATLSRERLLDAHCQQIVGQKLFDRYIDQYTRSPEDNLLSHLIATESDEHPRLTAQEIHSVIQALLVGGNDTTPGAISSAVLMLVRHPEYQLQLLDDVSKIGPFVEEALRIESPVQGLYRFAKRNVVLGGVAIPAGAPINLRYASGNLDEVAYKCPEEINLDRKGIRNHLAFGAGIHYCVGNILARMEVTVAVEHILARLGNLRLEPADFVVRYVDKLVIRNPEAVPLTFDRRD